MQIGPETHEIKSREPPELELLGSMEIVFAMKWHGVPRGMDDCMGIWKGQPGNVARRDQWLIGVGMDGRPTS